MKKVFAIAFIGSILAVSCSKKTENSLQDSNIMLEEPQTPAVTDSVVKTDSTPAVAIPNPSPSTDSTAAAK